MEETLDEIFQKIICKFEKGREKKKRNVGIITRRIT